MDNEFTYIDMSQFGHPEQLTNVAPSIIQQTQPIMVLVSEMPRLWQGLGMGTTAKHSPGAFTNDGRQSWQTANEQAEVHR